MPKRILSGKVVKKSGDKTVSVLVTRQTTHPIYKKNYKSFKKIFSSWRRKYYCGRWERKNSRNKTIIKK